MVFDKTGTLTLGQAAGDRCGSPRAATSASCCVWRPPPRRAASIPSGAPWWRARAARGSTLAAAEALSAPCAARAFAARWSGRQVLVGSARLLQELGVDTAALARRDAERAGVRGQDDDAGGGGWPGCVGLVAVADPIKPEASAVVQRPGTSWASRRRCSPATTGAPPRRLPGAPASTTWWRGCCPRARWPRSAPARRAAAWWPWWATASTMRRR